VKLSVLAKILRRHARGARREADELEQLACEIEGEGEPEAEPALTEAEALDLATRAFARHNIVTSDDL
jgi:hypothetical protein